MPKRKPGYCLVIFYDDEARSFNVVGPLTEDADVTHRTSELQAKGRRVRISTTLPETDMKNVPTKESIVQEGFLGYRYDPKLMW